VIGGGIEGGGDILKSMIPDGIPSIPRNSLKSSSQIPRNFVAIQMEKGNNRRKKILA
jgi:hypothetical protein